MITVSGSITSTGAACTELAYNGGALVGSVQIVIASIGTATAVQVSIYDNNVARSSTANTGNAWAAGKSPGYTGVGPGTTVYKPSFFQSARTGDQQGQTAPNTADSPDYWNIDTSGNLTLAAAPVAKATVAGVAAASAQGSGNFPVKDMTSTASVAAGTGANSARLLYRTTLAAGQAVTWTPPEGTGVSYGLQIVAEAAGMTALSGSYNAALSPTP